MRLAMTLLVRDGADLIEDNLRFHRAQGVDLFAVGATDPLTGRWRSSSATNGPG